MSGRYGGTFGVLPAVAAAAGDPEAVARACAALDDEALRRLIDTRPAPEIARALHGERVRRTFARIAEDLDSPEPTMYGGHASTERRTA